MLEKFDNSKEKQPQIWQEELCYIPFFHYRLIYIKIETSGQKIAVLSNSDFCKEINYITFLINCCLI